MAEIKIKDLSFKYPSGNSAALCNINLDINIGEFVLICGKSGCGKSTLLRRMKPILSPFGECSGGVFYNGVDAESMSQREQAEKIGFVMQDPENGIVCDKVWHELAFGLESLGYSQSEISARVAEMASFFGISNYFYKDVKDLSGGQKQLLNLAAVMTLQPSVLILDEPTSRLDPIAAYEFCQTLARINREFGTTIIISEHRFEEVLPISDRVVVMDKGRIVAIDTPDKIGYDLLKENNPMFDAMPPNFKVFYSINDDKEQRAPVTVKDAREWLLDEMQRRNMNRVSINKSDDSLEDNSSPVIEAKGVWFRYTQSGADVLRDLSFKVKRGEFYAILGGNGAGKSTAVSVLCGINRPYRGKVKTAGGTNVALLPQNSQTLFSHKTVMLCLKDAAKATFDKDKFSDKDEYDSAIDERIDKIIDFCELNELINRHPFDLSGGEQQRTALAIVLITEPDIIILDEATKGLDSEFKEKLADLLSGLCQSGKTIIAVSHDVEFCAKHADRCAMLFDGRIVSQDEPRKFFGGKSFYTTAANRMSRGMIDGAVLESDIIQIFTGNTECLDIKDIKANEKSDNKNNDILNLNIKKNDFELRQITDTPIVQNQVLHCDSKPMKEKREISNILTGIFMLVIFGIAQFMIYTYDGMIHDPVYIGVQVISLILLWSSIMLFSKGKTKSSLLVMPKKRKITHRTVFAVLTVIAVVPLTIFIGMYFFGNRKYYFISLLIILEIMIPFIFAFEKRKPALREIVIISVLCGIAIAGRAAFAMLPQFKPVLAVVIISAICFGAETGFLVGAITAFVSNFFFGQGPWTPWQMFAFGIIGFIGGIIFTRGILKATKINLCVFGFFSAIIIYGGIMNPASVLMWQSEPNMKIFLSAYVMGFPFDLIHAVSTAFFLWLGAKPMCEKIDRVKIKYGLYD